MSSKKCCCCCCIFLLVVLFVGLILLFVFRDRLAPTLDASYKVTDASLTQFGMGSGNNLEYNLVANMTVENSNKYSDLKYEKFEAVASYNDQDLNEVSLKAFEVGMKNKSELTSLVFKGQKSLKDDVVSKIKGSSSFDIVLKIKIKHLVRASKIDIYNEYKEECNLKVPLVNSKEKSAEKFQSTDCKKVGKINSGIKF